ncbi:putative MFS multidrug transporter [Xylogone sp. PMI_703]|nr:putative MFS multidrug transporter [Xylogone sp. PMI_703]
MVSKDPEKGVSTPLSSSTIGFQTTETDTANEDDYNGPDTTLDNDMPDTSKEDTDDRSGGDDETISFGETGTVEGGTPQQEEDLDIERCVGPDNVVGWYGPDDPENPKNFSTTKKWVITWCYALVSLCVTFASSIFSTNIVVTANRFNVSTEVTTLGVSLFILGFGVGPSIWGPLSELFGRKNPLLLAFFVFCVFQIPIAVAQNLETIMLLRFLGGVFGTASLAITGGALSDMFDNVNRSIALTIFSATVFIGPAIGGVIGAFITASYLGWRWCGYITTIMGFSFWIIALFTIPETYAPVLLQKRAKKIRHRTQNWAIHAKIDEQHVPMKAIATKFLGRPVMMLIKEPILLLITIYLATVYAILYLFFEAFPIAFHETRHWKPTVSSLPFISLAIGLFLGGAGVIWTSKVHIKVKVENGTFQPEDRLPAMAVGGILMPIGLFWFGWTSNPGVNWVPQVISIAFIGAGIMSIFTQGMNYIIDVYLLYANSALAGNTMVRSIFASVFPLFATAMYHRLGVNWASSLLGFLGLALVPVPIVFYIYGPKIRSMSKFKSTLAPTH